MQLNPGLGRSRNTLRCFRATVPARHERHGSHPGTSRQRRIRGLNGNDTICSGTGNDNATGGAGNDRLLGGGGNDRLNGAPGTDRISGGSDRDVLNGGTGTNTVRSCETVSNVPTAQPVDHKLVDGAIFAPSCITKFSNRLTGNTMNVEQKHYGKTQYNIVLSAWREQIKATERLDVKQQLKYGESMSCGHALPSSTRSCRRYPAARDGQCSGNECNLWRGWRCCWR